MAPYLRKSYILYFFHLCVADEMAGSLLGDCVKTFDRSAEAIICWPTIDLLLNQCFAELK